MLLASETAKERETKKLNEEIQDLLNAATAKEQMMSTKFKSQGGWFVISMYRYVCVICFLLCIYVCVISMSVLCLGFCCIYV